MRQAVVERKTNETEVKVLFAIEGSGKKDINTGVGFLDHMLELFVVHGQYDMNAACRGDLAVDCHHSVEDVGIVLGQAILQAAGDKKGIARYGNMMLPMDEALVSVCVDFSGRPYLAFNVDLPAQTIGNFDTEMAEEFFRAVAFNAGLTLHINLVYGKNTHHIIEACFKAFARALSDALRIDPSRIDVPSTKGVL